MRADGVSELWCFLKRLVQLDRKETEVVAPASVTVEPLNDSVYEVCRPAGVRRPAVEIVFFHGLKLENTKQQHITTWLSRDKSQIWLSWLCEDFPDARILTVSYDASVQTTDTEGGNDMFITCENLVQDLISKRANVGQDGCPVVLVGHCLGGLVLKEVCVKSNSILGLSERDLEIEVERVENFLLSLKGVFFYSTPHHGVKLPDSSSLTGFEGPLLKDMTPLNKYTERRNEDFRKLRQVRKWRAGGVAANRGVNVGRFTGLAWNFHVLEASSRHDIDGGGYYTVDANHIDVCRPMHRNCGSYQQLSAFIAQVVKEDQLRMAPKFVLPKKIVGMKTVLESVVEQLQSTSRLGIIGMGGVGKTTFSRVLFDSIQHRFDYASYVGDIKGLMGEERDIDHLQCHIVSRLRSRGRKVHDAFNWSRLRNKRVLLVLDNADSKHHVKVMRDEDQFSKESRLIVNARERNFLKSENFEFYDMKCLHLSDSEKLLALHAFGTEEIPTKFRNQATKLAKGCGNLPLALEVAGSCLYMQDADQWDDMHEAIAAAHSLDGNASDGLWCILRKSYDSLASREKGMFLDIAACFDGSSLSYIHTAWRACSWTEKSSKLGWENLLNKCLVSKTEVDTVEGDLISMHELLVNLGRRIASADYSTSISSHTRIFEIDRANKLRDEMETMKRRPVVKVLKLPRWDEALEVVRVLRGLHELEALWFEERGAFDHILEHEQPSSYSFFPTQLRYLNIKEAGGVALEHICRTSCLRCLVLESSNVGELPGSLGQLAQLEHLEIKLCPFLKGVPTEIGKLQSLRELHISSCYSLKSLPHSLAVLRALEVLKLEDCPELRMCLSDLLELPALKMFEMSRCAGVEGWYELLKRGDGWILTNRFTSPITIEDLDQMRGLGDVGVHVWDAVENTTSFYVSNVTGVPDFFSGSLDSRLRMRHLFIALKNCQAPDLLWGKFKELQLLEVGNCNKMVELPQLFGSWHLPALQELHIYEVPCLEALPDALGQLQSLRVLRLRTLSRLSRLPESAGQLHKLEILKLDGLPSLTWLPKSVRQLRALQELEIKGCKCLKASIKATWDLPSLNSLTLEVSRNDVSTRWASVLQTAGHLRVIFQYFQSQWVRGTVERGTNRLEAVAGNLRALFQYFQNQWILSTVDIGANLLEAASNGCFTSLKCLTLSGDDDCEAFVATVGRICTLKNLTIRNARIMSLEPVGELRGLERLTVEHISALEELPESFGQLECLKELRISDCLDLKNLPASFRKLGSLRRLFIGSCSSLKELPDSLGQLPALEGLEISCCNNLTELKGSVGQVRALDLLEISSCRKVCRLLQSVGQVGLLKRLVITTNKEELPASIWQLQNLEHLEIRNCARIKNVSQSIKQLHRLEGLTVNGYDSLEALPESLNELKFLKLVSVRTSYKIANLPSVLEQIRALEQLEIGCSGTDDMLEKVLKSVRQLGALKCLTISDCFRMTQLPESLGQLVALTHLKLENRICTFDDMQKLPESIGTLQTLEYLEIGDLRELVELPLSVGKLSRLRKIVIRRCKQLEQWRPSLAHVEHLQEMELIYSEYTGKKAPFTTLLRRHDLLMLVKEGRSLREAVIQEERLGTKL